MTYKKLIGIIFLSFLICNYSISEETIFNYSSDSTYGNDGRVSGNVGKIDVGVAVEKAKKLCKNLGFDPETEKFTKCGLDLIEVSNGFDMARNQEYILSKKLYSKDKIGMTFSYESKSGKKMNKESKWDKFWQGVGWVLYEHGDEIFALALDLKYDTNLSGYNTTNQVSTNRGGLRCVSQRVGTVVHQNCKGADGTHIYCMFQQIGKSNVKRTCRDKSRY